MYVSCVARQTGQALPSGIEFAACGELVLVMAKKSDRCVRGGCIYCSEKVVCIDSACQYTLCPKNIL